MSTPWICPKCTLRINQVRRYPIRCACGVVDHGQGNVTIGDEPDNEDFATPCVHRGEHIGDMNCNCAGNLKVYQCEKFGECATRKLKPGLPKIKYLDGREEQSDVKFCNNCEEYAKPVNPTETSSSH